MNDRPHAGRLEWLDSLRGIAALMVMLHHYTAISEPFAGLFDFGRTGVLLFFLISGYCIAYTLNRPSPRPVATFWIRRIFRLFPVYWAALASAWVLGLGAGLPPVHWLLNMTMVQQLFGSPYILGVAWTLFFEMLFYIAASLLVPFGVFGSRKVLFASCALLLLASLMAAICRRFVGFALPFAPPLFLTMFFAGACCQRLDRDRGWSPTIAWTSVPAAALAIAGISALVFGNGAVPGETWSAHFGNYVVAIALFGFFGYCVRIGSRPMVFVGYASYSLYLFHSLVSLALAEVFPDLPAVAFALLGIALSLVVAAMMFRLVEEPFIRAGRTAVATVEAALQPRPAAAD